ncbi:phosphate ABC transporter permease PstA [Facklamia sp. 7083-14-GEN3]|uniref:phosphate ABC transporter permease PstA n=1 Tax=Facklamia sp. 7083-14-GEN3 TaxID=2973478 RepID=UPI00215D3A7E|nr:phosphate ABC transporter permease PstA [Facklamia sp. 7083-14-GEN3]MCR8970000.1 phosphate ABC transporter permease PstA [Facklamia sp. 7083-14-GEN3]
MSAKIIRFIVWLAALFTIGMLLFIIGFILWNGLPVMNTQLFAWEYNSDNVSMMPAIISTLIMIGCSLLISAPIGVFSAFYLVEYADRGNRYVHWIRLATDTLAAVPSIVYGLFGMLLFVNVIFKSYSHIAGILTLSIMILPIIISSTEEALLSVNNSLRMGSLALGAGKLRTIFTVVLPVAMPGILSGIILAIGRIVGESAALIYTMGTSSGMIKNLLSSGRTLATHMYVLSSEGFHVKEAYATGAVLVLMVLIINWLSTLLGARLGSGGK